MKDSLVGIRKGWKRSRYGRAVALVKMRTPDGRYITVDPDHYKERILKLFGSVKPLPITQLTWHIDDQCSSTEQKVNDGKDKDNYNGKGTVVGEPSIGPNEEALTSINELDRESHNKAIEPEQQTETDPTINNIFAPQCSFSLGNLLGLQAESIQCQTSPKQSMEIEEAKIQPNQKKIAPLSELLFDISRLKDMPLSEYAFCRRSGVDEAFILWKEVRPGLRQEFKQRMKQTKKLAQRKSKLFNNKGQ